MYHSNHFASQNDVKDSADFPSSNPVHRQSVPQRVVASRAKFAAQTQSPAYKDLPSNLPPAEQEMFRDEQISGLFTAMGRATQLSNHQIAQRLQTSPELIYALEAGALDQLPEWEETSEIVVRYARFIKIDERPILRRLREQLTEHYLTRIAHKPHQEVEPKVSPMPMSDVSLKAFAAGNPPPLPQAEARHAHDGFSNKGFGDQRHAGTDGLGQEAINAVFQNVSLQNEAYHTPGAAQRMQQPYGGEHAAMNSYHHQQQNGYAYGAPVPANENTKRLNRFTKIAANVAFILILIVGFVHWQPNRFWSGVDQLPKPIANSIYTIFEMVMPDPLASTYRMNWVHVDDPRMRKADRLPVPIVKALPAIDFSNLGGLTK